MLSLRPYSSRPISTAAEPTFHGVFSLIGHGVGLRVARKLHAAAASLAFVGNDAALVLTFSPAALGRIPLVGTTATLTGAHNMRNNFTMVAGDSKTLVVTVTDADGSPVNISGATIAWRASKSFRKTATITKSTSSGIAITDGPNGVFAVTLAPADTDGLIGDYLHEAQVTDAQGIVSTVLQGTMKINRALITAG